MDIGTRIASADRLRGLLAASGDPLRLSLTDAQYQMQIRYTCDLLDVVDEVTDEFTALMITSVICERLTGAGAAAAAERIRQARAEIDRLAHQTIPLPLTSTKEARRHG